MSSQFSKQLAAILEQGRQNALIYLNRKRTEQKLSILDENNLFVCLKEIQDTLNLSRIPRRIECYDISHISGKYVYGSMVTFVDGQPAKKLYKLFKTKDRNDDFANHREVLTRRLNRYIESLQQAHNNQKILREKTGKADIDPSLTTDGKLVQNHPWALPDLFIIDGGKGQLSSDFQVLQQFDLLSQTNICSIAKRIEEIFVPDKTEPYIFQGQTLFLLQRIRDEAHRFAITANREARLKTASSSELDEIPGIGPKTKLKLLQTFGSVKNVIKTMDENPMLLHEAVGQRVIDLLKKRFG
ncbi:MAG: hypothetical protein OHK0017_10950 [Patescibacteria group bacterium]